MVSKHQGWWKDIISDAYQEYYHDIYSNKNVLKQVK